MIVIGHPGDNFTTWRTGAMHIAQYLAQQIILVVCFCCIAGANQSAPTLNKSTERFFLVGVDGPHIAIEHNHLSRSWG